MAERAQDPGPDDGEDVEEAGEGPEEIIQAALDELANPADESDEG